MEVKNHEKSGQIPPKSADIVEFRRRGGGGTVAEELSKLPRNDYGNSQRLIHYFGDDIMYVPNVGWHAWTGTHWSGDRGEEIAHLHAQEIGFKIKDEVAFLDAQGPWKDEDPKDFDKRIKAHAGWASTSGNSNKIKAMLIEAAVQLVVPLSELNQDKMVYNCLNCTLELRPRSQGGIKARPHDRADRITKIANVNYDITAKTQVFDGFLESILPDEDVRLFLMRWFGYSMTALTGEQCLAFFYGTGSNGKSTLMDFMSYINGTYASTLPINSFKDDDRKSGGQATPDLAVLPSIRYLCPSEPKKGFKFAEDLIKSMTGGEKMMMRNLHQGFQEFYPEFKITIAGNHKPIILGGDEGIWRRINLVLFNQHIPKHKCDRQLPEKLRAEASGVLNWMIDGLMMWLESGLEPPAAITEATDEYRMDSDPVGQFLEACTEEDDMAETSATELYQLYTAWCSIFSSEPMSMRYFGFKLSDKGLNKRKRGSYYYQGLKVVETVESLKQNVGEDYGEEDNI
ncbi:DNA primase family protein [Kiloniella sp.]|uniref:DNA primase family protein n=1 Tax=Kiloniella sp. TaxID=1938587 RepID=UPI003B029A85